MARPTPELIAALRETAQNLQDGAPYSWSLMSQCNCGNLAQTITGMTSKSIQRRALQRAGDWTVQAIEYCPSTGLPMEDVFVAMMTIGLTREDIGNLEKLASPAVVDRIPAAYLPLQHNRREDVIRYMFAWADLLEEQLLPKLPIPTPHPMPTEGATPEGVDSEALLATVPA